MNHGRRMSLSANHLPTSSTLNRGRRKSLSALTHGQPPRVPEELRDVFVRSNEKLQAWDSSDKPKRTGQKLTLRGLISNRPCQLVPPHVVLNSMIRERGYSTEIYNALESGYYNKPTPLQTASHGVLLSDLVRKGDDGAVRELLQAGLSPNPCNVFGESLLHTVCRQGDFALLNVFLEAGCTVQVVDDYGRTPLHDACWAPDPAFDVVKLLLKADLRLLYMTDCRGYPPLSYVHKKHWGAWVSFLKEIRDDYFPILQKPQGPPELTKVRPNSRPLPTPKKALPSRFAELVSSGKVKAWETNMLTCDDISVETWSLSDSTTVFSRSVEEISGA